MGKLKKGGNGWLTELKRALQGSSSAFSCLVPQNLHLTPFPRSPPPSIIHPVCTHPPLCESFTHGSPSRPPPYELLHNLVQTLHTDKTERGVTHPCYKRELLMDLSTKRFIKTRKKAWWRSGSVPGSWSLDRNEFKPCLMSFLTCYFHPFPSI